MPFLYQFKDLSSGNINAWSWDFGDGNSSSMQNPVHRYEQEGTYQVCLTVTDINNPDSCYDQSCLDVVTREYYSLGGLVFAGDHPLNNPLHEGDTGVAYLYRATGDQMVFVESHPFYEYGYYAFGFLLPGNYLVKVGLTPGSTHYGTFFTTYLGDGTIWQDATHITISDTNHYSAEIHMYPVLFGAAGSGKISGYVKYEQFNGADMPPAGQTTVILSNNARTPIRYTLPETSGYYEFTGLPFGTYFLTADATGKPSTQVTVTLSDNHPTGENINLVIFGSNVQGIPEEVVSGLTILPVYPNPAIDELNVRISSPDNYTLNLMISDLAGRTYEKLDVKVVPGLNLLTIPVASLPKGVYFIRLNPSASFLPVTGKFIK